MAPIEPDLSNSNLRPLSLLATYLAAAGGLTGFIAFDVLYKSFRLLPPSQSTRGRTSDRENHIRIFSLLAVTCLVITWYHVLSFLALSYKVWAYEMGEELPVQLWGNGGVYSQGSITLSLGRWLQDTSIFRDAWEIVIERSKRYWWSQQFFLGATCWAVFVGIEGRRRNIRHLWAFLLLGEIVAISFAMNLFFLAVLLTPLPLPAKKRKPSSRQMSDSTMLSPATVTGGQGLLKRIRLSLDMVVHKLKPYMPPLITSPHPPEWTPHPLAMIAPLAVIYICVFLLPFATSTSEFWPLLVIPHVALFEPLYLDRIAPMAYGSIRKPHRSYLPVYRFVSYASFALYVKQSLVALLDNDPGADIHRHSHYLSLWHLSHERERGGLSRSSTAFARVLGALGDHPATSGIGWDVLMCSLTLAVWAFARGLDLSRIASATGVAASSTTFHEHASIHDHQSQEETSSAIPSERPRRRRKPSAKLRENRVEDDSTFSADNVHGPIIYGEEEEPEDLEAGAVAGALYVLGGLGVMAAGVLGAELET